MLEVIETAIKCCSCKICGNPIGHEEPFFADARSIAHIDCLLTIQKEDATHGNAV